MCGASWRISSRQRSTGNGPCTNRSQSLCAVSVSPSCGCKGNRKSSCVARLQKMTERMIAIPPPPIHSWVTGKHMSDEKYSRLSEQLVDGLDKLLASQGLRVGQFRSVLDFGCGCGRILAQYVPLV